MKTFEKWYEDYFGEKMPEGNLPYEWFVEHGFPVVVHCTCCDGSMALPDSIVSEDRHLYCRSCAEECFEEGE